MGLCTPATGACIPEINTPDFLPAHAELVSGPITVSFGASHFSIFDAVNGPTCGGDPRYVAALNSIGETLDHRNLAT
jgi:hypothetical protein